MSQQSELDSIVSSAKQYFQNQVNAYNQEVQKYDDEPYYSVNFENEVYVQTSTEISSLNVQRSNYTVEAYSVKADSVETKTAVDSIDKFYSQTCISIVDSENYLLAIIQSKPPSEVVYNGNGDGDVI